MAVASARVAAAAIGLGVGVVVVGAAALLPLPTVGIDAPSVEVTPVPTAQQLVCPGGVLRLGDESGADADTAVSLGTPAVVSGGAPQVSAAEGAGAPGVLSSSAGASVSGAQSQELDSAEFAGLATSACAPVSTDSWLVGGATTTGRTTLLSLVNPGDVDSTVSLEIFTEQGPVDAPGAAAIPVAARTQVVFSLAGFAPDAVSPVVHVSSVGGRVAASLQQTVVRGLDPSGADIVAPTAGPAASVTVPGVVAVTSEEIEALVAEGDANADLATVVRVLAPEQSATVLVSVVPEDTDVAGTSFEVAIAAGAPTDIPLEGLEPGSFTVKVASEHPVVAAVRTSVAASGGDGASDLAWVPAPESVSVATSVSVPEGPDPVLHLANPGAVDAEVVLEAGNGTSETVTVPAESSVSTDVAEGAYVLTPSAAVLASVSLESETLIGSVLVQPRAPGAGPVLVHP
jgi:hypothetical protein